MRHFPFKPFTPVALAGSTSKYVLSRLDRTLDRLSWLAEIVDMDTCACLRKVPVEQLSYLDQPLHKPTLPREYSLPFLERPAEFLSNLQNARAKYLLENQFKRSKPRQRLNEDGTLAEPRAKKLNKSPGTRKTNAQAQLDKFADLERILLSQKKD